MKTLTFIMSILIFMSFVSSASSTDNTKSYPFSYEELLSAEKASIPSLQYLKANDKTKLAYREYVPKQITAVLHFIMVGAHMLVPPVVMSILEMD